MAIQSPLLKAAPSPAVPWGQWPADRMPEAPARFKLRFSREMRTVPAAACVPPRAIIRLPKYKNISQFVLFMEHSISTWKGAPRPASWLRSTFPSRQAVRAPGALGPPGGSLPYPGSALARAPPTSPDVCGHSRVQPPEVGGPRGTGRPRPSGSVGHGRSVCSPVVLVFIFWSVKYTHRKSCILTFRCPVRGCEHIHIVTWPSHHHLQDISSSQTETLSALKSNPGSSPAPARCVPSSL